MTTGLTEVSDDQLAEIINIRETLADNANDMLERAYVEVYRRLERNRGFNV